MERHKCKLCSRTFANGRALGGHMKAHLASLRNLQTTNNNNNNFTESTTSSSSSEENREEEEGSQHEDQEHDKVLNLNYGLRDNPRKCFKFADPDEFSFPNNNSGSGGGSGVFIQDGESETESKTPVRKRSKLNCKRIAKRPEDKIVAKEPLFGSVEPEQEPVSSVSDISAEEDVAMCLVMLSRDRWSKKEMLKHQCETCNKVFRSSQALGGHRVTHRKNSNNNNNINSSSNNNNGNNNGKNNVGANHDRVGSSKGGDDHQNNEKVFECPFCYKVFGSGQALGGHKRSHLIGLNNNNNNSKSNSNFKASKSSNCLIDLNLPAPEEEDQLSVVSDAELVDGAGA